MVLRIQNGFAWIHARRTLAGAILAVAAVAACETGTIGAGGPREGVTVVEATPERVAGTFAGRGLVLKFDTVSTPAVRRFELSNAADVELLRIEQKGDEVLMEVFGGRATRVVNLQVIEASARLGEHPEEATDDFSTSEGLVDYGDPQAFEEFERTPEFLALPYLSSELGKQGKHGGAFPSTVALHWLAMNSAQAQELDFDAFRGREAGAQGYCTDLRSDPCGNESLGMCGPGMGCWESLCGDCCCHQGCKSHDSTCRNCKWYRPWNCALCYTGTSWFWGACGSCESCDMDQFHEVQCIPPGTEYTYCSADSDCCGHAEGSSEYGPGPLGSFCGFDNLCHTCWDGSIASYNRCN